MNAADADDAAGDDDADDDDYDADDADDDDADNDDYDADEGSSPCASRILLLPSFPEEDNRKFRFFGKKSGKIQNWGELNGLCNSGEGNGRLAEGPLFPPFF